MVGKRVVLVKTWSRESSWDDYLADIQYLYSMEYLAFAVIDYTLNHCCNTTPNAQYHCRLIFIFRAVIFR